MGNYIKIDDIKQEIINLVLPKSLNDFLYISFIDPVYKEIYEWCDDNFKKDFVVLFGGKKWYIKNAHASIMRRNPLYIKIKFESFLNSPQLVQRK